MALYGCGGVFRGGIYAAPPPLSREQRCGNPVKYPTTQSDALIIPKVLVATPPITPCPNAMRKFIETLTESWRRRQSLLCVGLDPDLEKLPAALRRQRTPLFAFCREIIDATAPWVCAFKPQIACYAAVGAEAELEQTIDYIKQHHPDIPVILDAKRGDIGPTAKLYAREAFERYRADAVTVNPYLGGDALAPFLDYVDKSGADKGVFILCRTSNPGSGDLQELPSDGRSLAHHVAVRAATHWNGNGNVGLVVGATWPREVGAIRKLVGDMPLLIPGIGAQGGNLKEVLANGLNADGSGVLINASRAVIYAGAATGAVDKNFAEAAAQAAETLCRQINAQRNGPRN